MRGQLLLLCLLAVQGQTTTASGRVCGDGHCLCHKTQAYCSGKNLTYIPRLNANMTYIDLSHNIFPNLSEASWVNITSNNITKLVMSFCLIHRLEPTTFEQFRNLRTLILNDNPVHATDLAAAMMHPHFFQLRALYLCHLMISDISFFLHMKALDLTHIYLDNNRLMLYNSTLFSRFKNLNYMSVERNQISAVTFAHSKSLFELSLRDNEMSKVPHFCDGKVPYFPQLNKLYLSNNKLDFRGIQFDCLPRLEYLGLKSTNFQKIPKDSFVHLPNLKVLMLQYLPMNTVIEPYAFANNHLQELYLSKSHLDINKYVDMDAFRGLPNLHKLEISYNNLRDLTDQQMFRLCGHLNTLQKIHMADCYLKTIPTFIGNLKNLTSLVLYGNQIKLIPDGSFDKLKHLQLLLLNRNEISTIKETAISNNVRESLSAVDLKQNPFICDCNLQWFIDWRRRNRTSFKGKTQQYKCNGPLSKANTLLDDIYFSQNECLLSLTQVAVIVATSGVLVCAVTILSLLYKLRWRIRYLIYVNYYRKRQQHVQIDAQNFAYDAYVIHSEEDQHWVVEEMIACLEDENDIKLCVPSRDFHPGKSTLNNIDTAIQTSRHIIVVLSASFVENEWCQAELTIAQSFILDTRGNPLLTVVLGEPDARNMRHSLHVLLRSTAYIIWGEEEEARQFFWRRLVESLGNNVNGDEN